MCLILKQGARTGEVAIDFAAIPADTVEIEEVSVTIVRVQRSRPIVTANALAEHFRAISPTGINKEDAAFS